MKKNEKYHFLKMFCKTGNANVFGKIKLLKAKFKKLNELRTNICVLGFLKNLIFFYLSSTRFLKQISYKRLI